MNSDGKQAAKNLGVAPSAAHQLQICRNRFRLRIHRRPLEPLANDQPAIRRTVQIPAPQTRVGELRHRQHQRLLRRFQQAPAFFAQRPIRITVFAAGEGAIAPPIHFIQRPFRRTEIGRRDHLGNLRRQRPRHALLAALRVRKRGTGQSAGRVQMRLRHQKLAGK